MRLLVVLVVAFLSGCAATDAPKAMWIPPDSAWDSARSQGARFDNPGRPSRFVSSIRVNNLLTANERLGAASGVRAQLAIFDSETPNAHAFLHGGTPTIGFTFGLLDLLGDDPDALAGIVGHELAHIHLKHDPEEHMRRDKQAEGLGNIAGMLLGPVGLIAGAGITAYSRSFSRDEERAADEYGLQWAAAAGYDPCGQVRAMDAIKRMGSVNIPILSRHPGFNERSESAKALANRTGKQCQ